MANRAWATALFSVTMLVGACSNPSNPEETTSTTADFESERSAPADGLTDVDWVFGLVEVDGSPIEPPPDNRTSMTLRSDGTVEGGGGCNDFVGTWTTSGGTEIEFSALTVDEEDCGETKDWFDAIDLLAQIDSWELDDLTLVLTNADGGRIVAVAS